MDVSKRFLLAVFLIGSLSSPVVSVGAAEKSGMMEHDKGMTKDDKEKMKKDKGMMEDAKGMMEEGAKEKMKAKGAMSGDKMKMDDKMKK